MGYEETKEPRTLATPEETKEKGWRGTAGAVSPHDIPSLSPGPDSAHPAVQE